MAINTLVTHAFEDNGLQFLIRNVVLAQGRPAAELHLIGLVEMATRAKTFLPLSGFIPSIRMRSYSSICW
jgi:hypothetical protein